MWQTGNHDCTVRKGEQPVMSGENVWFGLLALWLIISRDSGQCLHLLVLWSLSLANKCCHWWWCLLSCQTGKVLHLLPRAVPGYHFQHHPAAAYPVLHPEPHHALHLHILSDCAGVLPPVRQRRKNHPVHLYPAGSHCLLPSPVRHESTHFAGHPADWQVPVVHHVGGHGVYIFDSLLATYQLQAPQHGHHVAVGAANFHRDFAAGAADEAAGLGEAACRHEPEDRQRARGSWSSSWAGLGRLREPARAARVWGIRGLVQRHGRQPLPFGNPGSYKRRTVHRQTSSKWRQGFVREYSFFYTL